MKESQVIDIINKIVDNSFLGDDCAYIKDLGIVITQDSLVENIHFKRNWCTPFQLGYKSVAVNISDILAAGATPKYLTISLSLTDNLNEKFVEEFYKGAKSVCPTVKIVGGDITGSKNEIFISVTAIGSDYKRKISSRKNAKEGYVVITEGEYGSSAEGLKELKNNEFNGNFVKAHLMPSLNFDFSEQISSNADVDYAMMDTSDGLCDALFKIAESSNVTISADYSKIPRFKNVSEQSVLFGGEDYNLIAAVPKYLVKKIKSAIVIGEVVPYNGTRLNISGRCYNKYEELNIYNHFGDKNE